MSIAQLQDTVQQRVAQLEDEALLLKLLEIIDALEVTSVSPVAPVYKDLPKEPIGAASIGLLPDATLEEIVAEQGKPPITYEEFRAVADQIDWGDVMLEDLLEALD